MADGGEGSLSVPGSMPDCVTERMKTLDPLAREIESRFIYNTETREAWLETATTDGLPQLAPEERNPLRTTSYGLGQQLLRAIELGSRKINIFLGGSASVDGGTGMLQAAGAVFRDHKGEVIREIMNGGVLENIGSVDCLELQKKIASVEITGLCDVTSPLLGINGAATVFGPQKGADSSMVQKLEKGMTGYSRAVDSVTGYRRENDPGAGAAGGLGYAILWALNGRLKSGVEEILRIQELERKLDRCDLVITGEGSIDSQTLMGKGPGYIAACARRKNIPVIGICGQTETDIDLLQGNPFTAVFATLNKVYEKSLVTDAALTEQRIKFVTRQIYRIMKLNTASK
jgi:glycerate kinase